MRKVPFMDQSGVYALEASIEDLRAEGVLVVITEPNEQVMEKMKGMKIIPRLVSENHVFNDFKNCKVWLKEVISSEEKLAAELALLN
jgi:SulP family sulfate permease